MEICKLRARTCVGQLAYMYNTYSLDQHSWQCRKVEIQWGLTTADVAPLLHPIQTKKQNKD